MGGKAVLSGWVEPRGRRYSGKHGRSAREAGAHKVARGGRMELVRWMGAGKVGDGQQGGWRLAR
jgi:hypothetical protein